MPPDPPPITFSVTTCRRRELFFRSIDSFLRHCEDPELIARWICVDDGSSEVDRAAMAERYPFFEFVFKEQAERGHSGSIARIWQLCATELLFHTEDDWEFQEPLSLGRLVEALGDRDQLVLWRFDLERDWSFNPQHRHVVGPVEAIARAHGLTTRPKQERGWWWPGFTLNPSLLRLARARELVPEVPAGERFEFEYALALHLAGFKVRRVPARVAHLGEMSAYVLSDQHRAEDPSNLAKRMMFSCVDNPALTIELGRYLDLEALAPDAATDALHALATAQWYLDRDAGQQTLRELWRRFHDTGRLLDPEFAELLGHYGQSWADLLPAAPAVERRLEPGDGGFSPPDAPPALAADGEITLVVEGDRPRLVRRAIDAFCACCTDRSRVGRWLAVVDEVDDAERDALERAYPWIELDLAGPGQRRGRVARLEALRARIETPYVFLLDPQLELVVASDYLGRCLDGLSVSPTVGQCLLDAGYGQTPNDGATDGDDPGGLPFAHRDRGFVAHLYDPEATAPRPARHWPHLSLSPSLWRREVWDLGFADLPYFELELARRYVAAGWRTIFLPGSHHRRIAG